MNWRAPEKKTPRVEPLNAAKILVQYRAKGSKVYELQNAGAVVAVRVREDRSDAVPSTWHVDVLSQSSVGPSAVEASGTTAAEALKEVARAWNARLPALTAFDWDAIAKELRVVQAI